MLHLIPLLLLNLSPDKTNNLNSGFAKNNMHPTKEQAYQKIALLIERFQEHVEAYKRGSYNEHQTRVDYINPFFKALGWDMDNEQGYAEAYREVIHEDKIKVGSATKAPDYGFTLFGQRKFFVDAKKPGINIKSDIAPAYQVRRYGWSAKVPISVVTDFEEFSIYDCTKKPKPNEKASVARIRYLTYDKYLEEFDFLWDVFAKENLPKGRFDKYVASDTKKKGTATVDDEFLKSIEQWRTYLATTIALRNKSLDEDEINYAVQKTIDRIIFLRMCEDRGVEPYGNLKKAAESGDIYSNLFQLYRVADDKYNSGLFNFKEDVITPSLVIDNKVLKNIVKELYYPHCEYEFSVMPADILGSVYERFLGKTIRLTKGHSAKVEEKPEVRKAGGVYYTPKYIVDYIVEHTVGKLVEGKTPKQVEQIRICDPACGSGSFLIGAYQYLLNWHLKYYIEIQPKKKKDSPLTPDGNLTTAEKKRILLNNIYGVDIDTQAVEVTKLNLLLKALEGETQASINQQMQLFHERVLPNLNDNIKCGNSLIGSDFYDDQLELFPGQMKKINAFDWEEGFPEVFAKGGFDVVIGNPPYVRQELLGDQKDYFKAHYKVYHGVADLYTYFFEKGIELLNKDGLFGIIVANKWMRTNYGYPLRRWFKERTLYRIIDFGDLPVFQNVTTYPCIVIAGRSSVFNEPIKVTETDTLQFTDLEQYVTNHEKNVSKENLKDEGWQMLSDEEVMLLNKLYKNATPLDEYVMGKIYRGVLTGLNEAFIIDEGTKERLINEDAKSAEIIKPFLAGRDIKRYQSPHSDKYLILFPRGFTNKHCVGRQPRKWLKETYPAIANHLEPFEIKAQKRWDKGDYWWELRACDYYDEFEKPKIIYPNILKRPEFTFDKKAWYTNQKCFIISLEDKHLLGILNSRLMHYWFSTNLPKLRGGFFEPSYVIFKHFPVSKNSKDQIIDLVSSLLDLNAQLQSTKLETQRQQLQRAIAHAEKKIDELVYELYGLTEEEIDIVEKAT
jgi:type I restriction-modification system DNA methylase subunit